MTTSDHTPISVNSDRIQEAERCFLSATADLLLETLVAMPSGLDAAEMARQWHDVLGVARTREIARTNDGGSPQNPPHLDVRDRERQEQCAA